MLKTRQSVFAYGLMFLLTATAHAAPAEPTPDEPATPVPLSSDTPLSKATETAPADLFTKSLVSVYNNHPQLKAEREALEAIDETVNQAISGWRPSVIADYSRGRERTEINDGGRSYQDTSGKGISVVQPVFRGGQTVYGTAAARERVKAGRARLTAVEQQVLFDAVVAYTAVVEAQSVLEANRTNLELLGKELEATTARFEVGELTRTDTAQSEARLASAEASERQAQGDLEAARATFKRVMGFDPPPILEMPPVPVQVLPATLDETIKLAIAADPTLEEARRLEKAASKDVNVNRGVLFPSVDLRGDMDRSTGGGAFGSSRRVDNDAVTVNVTIPLYQSGAEWSRVRQAKNIAQQARFAAIDTENATVENAVRAWQDYNTAKAVIDSNEEAVRAADVALEGIRQENQYGVRTILDVLNTQQELFSTRVNLITATVAEKQQAYRLLAAVGRLTARDLRLPVNLVDPHQHYDDVKYKLIGF